MKLIDGDQLIQDYAEPFADAHGKAAAEMFMGVIHQTPAALNLNLLVNNPTNGDVMHAMFDITLDDFEHMWGSSDVTKDWWNTPYTGLG